jgi:two-component system sensor histidine kinase and response regulator WspE
MNDFSMLGLFKMEAESQCAVLSSGLLELENNPSAADKIEPLMRAAHSLKGAARIVQLDPIVKIAHAMEDCFVAAGEGKLVLTAEHIDKLLESIDCFNQLSACSENEIPAYLSENSAKLTELEKSFTNIKNGNFKSVPVIIAPPAPIQAVPPALEPPSHEHPAHTEKASADKDAVVRIAADKMNRLMGLAAESLVGVKRLQGFEKKILRHKKRLLEIAALIDQLEQNAVDSDQFSGIKRILKDIQHKHNEYYRDYTEYFADFSDYSRTMDNFSDNLYREVVSCRMRPFIEGVRDFPRSVRDLARKLGKKVSLEISGESIAVDKDILDKLNAPLNHLVRNAVDHGIETPEERLKSGKNETGSIRLTARHWAGMLNISVADDGKGIDIEKIRAKAVNNGLASADIAAKLTEPELLEFMFLPGFSTASEVTEISGRGVGLDVVQTMAQEVRGMIKVETELGKGTSFNLQVPVSLSVLPSLVATISGEPYAFPLMRIDHLLKLPKNEILTLESRQYVKYEGKNIGLVSAAQVLELAPGKTGPADIIHVVIISDRLNQYAIFVDSFTGEFELVVRPLDHRLGKVSDISSTSVLEDGSPVLILDIDDMVRSIDSILNGGRLQGVSNSQDNETVSARKRVLVVDDSITVREVERKLLENNGYDVDVAVDGAEGWNAVRAGQYALVVTDVDMPRMNGIELVANIKKHERLHSLPVMIVSYKDREEDRLRGLEAGADYYLTKSSFHDNTLLDAVENLIGKAGE